MFLKEHGRRSHSSLPCGITRWWPRWSLTDRSMDHLSWAIWGNAWRRCSSATTLNRNGFEDGFDINSFDLLKNGARRHIEGILLMTRSVCDDEGAPEAP